MTNKNMAIVAYCTIIGWVIVYFEYKKRADKSPLVNYHLGQALGLFILTFIVSLTVSILGFIVPSLYFLSLVVTALSIVLLLLGIITANNEAIKPLPVVGKLFVGKFNFA